MVRKKYNKLRQALAGVMCAGILFSQVGIVYAAETTPTPDPHTEGYYLPVDTDSIKGWPKGPKIEGKSAVLMDVVTETVLYSKNADEKMYPASITKILTTLLACENLNMNDKLVMSEAATYSNAPGNSSIYADVGEEFTVQQALMAVMLESANEVAYAVGEQVSGSMKKFVELMNRRAKELGCKNSHFNNPSGLPDETHYTTANDMANIAKAAWFNPLFRKFCTKDIFEIPPTNKFEETRYLLNHHKMMPTRDYAYEGVLGGKTGYTQVSGNTLVTYAKRGNTILMAVVMGSVNGAWSDTAALLDYGFNNFEKLDMELDKTPVPVKNLPCEKYLLKNNGNTFPFYYIRRVYVTVPAGTDKKDLKRKQYILPNAVSLPRMKCKYYLDGHMVGWGMEYEKEILSDLLFGSTVRFTL